MKDRGCWYTQDTGRLAGCLGIHGDAESWAVASGLVSETYSDRRLRGDLFRHLKLLWVAEELLGGLGLPYVEELVMKERVGLGGWKLHSAAEACLAVLLPVQQSLHREGSVAYQPRDLMEKLNKIHPGRSSTQAVSLSVWLPGCFVKAMH
jgi:hypothetical protein